MHKITHEHEGYTFTATSADGDQWALTAEKDGVLVAYPQTSADALRATAGILLKIADFKSQHNPPLPLPSWLESMDTRHQQEILLARTYVAQFNHGTSGHLTYNIIAKLADLLDEYQQKGKTMPDQFADSSNMEG